MALALALPACAGGASVGRTSTLHLDPGPGTIEMRDFVSGERSRCGEPCASAHAAGAPIVGVVHWPRPEGDSTSVFRLRLAHDLALRAEWRDRRALREAGFVVLLVSLGVGAGFVVAAADLGEHVVGFDRLNAELALGLGAAAAGLLAVAVGLPLAGLRDAPHLVPMVVPYDDGAVAAVRTTF